MAAFISIPGTDGEVTYVKRQYDLPIRVVKGKELIEWLKSNEDWEKIQGYSTLEFVEIIVQKWINEKKPRLYDFLGDDVGVLAKRQENRKEQKKIKSSTQILGFAPTFFQKKDETYGTYDPDYNFISHVWASPVKDLLGYLGSTSLSNWTDIFAVAQLPGNEQLDDLRNIAEAVSGAAEFKLMVDSDGVCFTRIWCLFELSLRIRSGNGQISFIVPEVFALLNVFSFDDLALEERKLYWRESARILERVIRQGIDCVNAKASVEADRKRILNWIEKEIGIEQFNKQIITLIKEECLRLRMGSGPKPSFDTADEYQNYRSQLREAAQRRKEMMKK